MLRAILALLLAVALAAAVGLGSASAAPIFCPGPQVATKTADGWDCVNRGGNESGAAETKNPTD